MNRQNDTNKKAGSGNGEILFFAITFVFIVYYIVNHPKTLQIGRRFTGETRQ